MQTLIKYLLWNKALDEGMGCWGHIFLARNLWTRDKIWDFGRDRGGHLIQSSSWWIIQPLQLCLWVSGICLRLIVRKREFTTPGGCLLHFWAPWFVTRSSCLVKKKWTLRIPTHWYFLCLSLQTKALPFPCPSLTDSIAQGQGSSIVKCT